jgi:hypothetical protein
MTLGGQHHKMEAQEGTGGQFHAHRRLAPFDLTQRHL